MISFRVKGYQNDTLCFEGRFTSVFIVAGGLHMQHAPAEIRKIVEPLLIAESE